MGEGSLARKTTTDDRAAKATMPGKPSEIVVRAGPGSTGMSRLEVIDQAEGIAPALRERVFEPFFTDGVVGKGSTFRVELPVAPSDEEPHLSRPSGRGQM